MTSAVIAPVRAPFMQDRDVPADWVRRLREISPESDVFSFLELAWEPGDPWEPVQRWTIYQMIHPKRADPEKLAELRGPHPRSQGHVCTSVPLSDWVTRPPKGYQPCLCRHKLEGWKGGPSSATLTEWQLFRRTGYVAHDLFWVIQGTHGGHRLAFSDQERQLLEAEGYPTDPPAPGVLDYAPFDERVARAIVRFNRLWAFKGNIDAFRRAMGPEYSAYQAEIKRELRRQLVDEIKTEMADVNDLFIRAARTGQMDDQPRTEIDFEKLDELNDERFIETGHILSQHTAL